MSLDVFLRTPGEFRVSEPSVFVRADGATRELTRDEFARQFPGREPVMALLEPNETEEVYSANITHNLNRMADAAGIYKALWRPDEIGISKASQLIDPLRAGLQRLVETPSEFIQLNPQNGWGTYEGLVAFVGAYLKACEESPDADVSVSR